MPSDIIGHTTLDPTQRSWKFQREPIFSQVVLAEELNRATPKTQSALLEAMAEHTVSYNGVTYKLPRPFFVLATRNPTESEGTYPLPDSQMDRFLFRIDVELPSHKALTDIFLGSTLVKYLPLVVGSADVEDFQIARTEVLVSQAIAETTARLVVATWPDRDLAPPSTKQFVRAEVSVRAGKAAIAVAQTNALACGRSQVILDDLHWGFVSCFPHRITLNFEGEAEGIPTGNIVSEIWEWLCSRLK